jgi:hypothetical protein
MGCALADADFNSHSRDRKGSSGIKSAYFGVEAEGQGLGLGTYACPPQQTTRLSLSHAHLLLPFLHLFISYRDWGW